jgi:GT2 family glycosyltransferase
MTRPTISVILPTFNRSHITIKAIESVLDQTYTDWELIVVDDGSTDSTWTTLSSQCEAWEKRFSPSDSAYKKIQLFRKEHEGVASARNFGVNKSTGIWISFLDSDDVWHPQKLELQLNFHMENPKFRISQTTEQWIRNGIAIETLPKLRKKSGNFYTEALERCLITSSSVMIHRDLWLETGGFREEMPSCEDYDLWLRILYKGEEVGLIENNLLTRFGGHPDQLSSKYPAIERFRIYSQFNLLLEMDSVEIEFFPPNRQKLVDSLLNRLLRFKMGRTKRGKNVLEIEDLISHLGDLPNSKQETEYQNSSALKNFRIEKLSFLLDESEFI